MTPRSTNDFAAGPLVGVLRRDRFVVLLAGLFALLLSMAIANLLAPWSRGAEARLLSVMLFVVMVLTAVNAVSESRRSLLVALTLALPAVLLDILGLFTDGMEVSVLRYLLTVAFLGYMIIAILRFLFVPQIVNANLICGSLCGYLLLGVLWANVYRLIEVVEPESFRVHVETESERPQMQFKGDEASLAVYYSFVTLTTLGYGDIIPRTGPARVLSALEAVMGQLYLTVLVARLVGLHVVHVESESLRQYLVANGGRVPQGLPESEEE